MIGSQENLAAGAAPDSGAAAEPGEPSASANPAAPAAPEAVVRIDGLRKRFGAFEALRGVSMTIRKGDIYGLLGLNGAGKTTTLRVLLGLLGRDSGEVEIFGADRDKNGPAAAERIGAMIESPAFYPNLSGRANLDLLYRLGPGARRPGVAPAEALELTGLAEAANVKIRKYSMGMRQRFYLAQALLSSPDLLVLDEPTSNLDPRGILEVRRLIQRLNQERGLTILFSSHQLNEVAGVCNRVGIINRGRMLLESDVQSLFQSDMSRVEIETPDAERAAETLRGLAWVERVEPVEGGLRAAVPSARRAELNALLNGEGVAVAGFAEIKPTLEDFFHERVELDVEPS